MEKITYFWVLLLYTIFHYDYEALARRFNQQVTSSAIAGTAP